METIKKLSTSSCACVARGDFYYVTRNGLSTYTYSYYSYFTYRGTAYV